MTEVVVDQFKLLVSIHTNDITQHINVPAKFYQYFRMSRFHFNALLLKTENDITEQNSTFIRIGLTPKRNKFYYAFNI
jgi:hypothetical protein